MKNLGPKVDDLKAAKEQGNTKEKKAALKKLRVATGLSKAEMKAIFESEGDA